MSYLPGPDDKAKALEAQGQPIANREQLQEAIAMAEEQRDGESPPAPSHTNQRPLPTLMPPPSFWKTGQ